MNNDLIYIFGHKNPDTDTVVAAISLSYLKNKLGYNSLPFILGNINSETKYALDYFKVEEPNHLNDVKLQIKDINYHKNTYIDKNVSIKDAFIYLNKYSLTGVPVVENKNKYYGFVSLKEIVNVLFSSNFNKIYTSYGNIIKILNGNKILKYDKEISGNVVSITYENDNYKNIKLNNSSIVVVEDSYSVIDYAIENKVKLIIIVSNMELNKELYDKATNNKINIISTPYSAYEVGSYLAYSNYIKNIISEDEIVTVSELDYLSDFLEESKKIKNTNYPVVNGRKECLGLVTISDTTNANKKKVILVDHNNYSMSVDGLEEAEILEIIDHHNIGDIITRMPINFRTDRVGSVNTIIYNMFIEKNVKIPPSIAGLMASAIISDTLLLTSPTTTKKDEEALVLLSKIANINYKKYGVDLLKQGMSINGLSNEQLLFKDFKSYKVNNDMIGIGQVLTSDYDLINKEEMVDYLDYISEKNNYKVLTIFITDIFNNTSHCLYNKSSQRIIKNSFNLEKVYEGIELKNILSRKIQIAPNIMEAIDRD